MSHNPIARMLRNDSDSDEEELLIIMTTMEEQQQLNARRGSILGRRFIDRGPIECHNRLINDYFGDSSVYPPRLFRRRFRMSRYLYLRIHSALIEHNPYFVQKRNSAGCLGLSSLQKMTVALRMLAYGVSGDHVDKYVRIGESTALKSLKKFVKAVIAIFSNEYLRLPNENDIARLLAIGSSRGFPDMVGSINCMHWKWKNFPIAWKGMFFGHIREPTIILKAIATFDLWIWHAFFGLPRSHNDINVLERSFVFSELTEDRAPEVNYTINGHNYTMGYYLADGIYPAWSTFVKTIPLPEGRKEKHFAGAQESASKDIERAFGVLQARFAIVRQPARLWKRGGLKEIMMACIILHNMIVKYEREVDGLEDFSNGIEGSLPSTMSRQPTNEILEFIQNHHRIRDRETHSQLQLDLMEQLWELHGQT